MNFATKCMPVHMYICMCVYVFVYCASVIGKRARHWRFRGNDPLCVLINLQHLEFFIRNLMRQIKLNCFAHTHTLKYIFVHYIFFALLGFAMLLVVVTVCVQVFIYLSAYADFARQRTFSAQRYTNSQVPCAKDGRATGLEGKACTPIYAFTSCKLQRLNKFIYAETCLCTQKQLGRYQSLSTESFELFIQN